MKAEMVLRNAYFIHEHGCQICGNAAAGHLVDDNDWSKGPLTFTYMQYGCYGWC